MKAFTTTLLLASSAAAVPVRPTVEYPSLPTKGQLNVRAANAPLPPIEYPSLPTKGQLNVRAANANLPPVEYPSLPTKGQLKGRAADAKLPPVEYPSLPTKGQPEGRAANAESLVTVEYPSLPAKGQRNGRATTTTSYLARMADTWVSRGVEKDFGYTNQVLYKGYELAIELTQNASYADWYEDQLSIVGDDGTITTDSEEYNYTFHSLDEYRVGSSMLYWYNRTGEEKYKLGADKVYATLQAHPRNDAGGFWHREPVYTDQMWGDGIFMADSFYSQYTSAFDADNTTAWDDIVLQYDLLEENCRNTTTNLLYHGYDESKAAEWADPTTGASPLVWNRAVGWYFVSLTETIQLIPTSHEGYAKLVGYFQTLAEGLLNAQDASGGWWLIMDEEHAGADGNYIESSASAMFTYGFLLGVRLGLLDEATYLPAAKTAYELLLSDFVVESADGLDWQGTVSVGSLGSDATYEYYVGVETAENDFKGVGPFMWASYELELL